MKTDLLKKRWTYLINGFLVLLFMGICYAWSIFVVPLEETFGWVRAQTSLAFTLNMLFFTAGIMLTGFLSKKFRYSTLLKVAAIMIGVGFFATSYANQIWQIYLTYSFCCGLGIGIGYNCAVSSVPLWFPDKTGMSTGTLVMGFALSAAIFGPVLNNMIGSIGIAMTFRTLAIVCTIALFAGSFLMKTPTQEEQGMLPQKVKTKEGKEKNFTMVEMLKSPIFWIYFVLGCMLVGCGLSLVSHVSPLMTEELSASAAFAALIVSVLSITNGLGRLIWGILYDKLGLKKVLGGIVTIVMVSFGLILVAMKMQGITLFVVASCMLMFAYGGNMSMIPTVVRELFGSQTFSLNYSIYNMNGLIASFIPTVVGLLQIRANSYFLPFLCLFGIAVVNVLLSVVMMIIYKKEYE